MLRRIPPLLRALGGLVLGLACLAYGYAFHTAAVLVDQAGPAPGPEAAVDFSAPGELAPLLPAPKQRIEVTEGEMVRDATVGGITRLPDGQLARTYVGKPTQSCPT